MLYILARFAFRISIILFVSQIIFEVFTPDGKIGSFSVGAHHSKGCPVQAQIQFNLGDSIIHYKNKFESGSISKAEIFEENDKFKKIK